MSAVAARGRAFVIDGHSFCYRAFYAIRNLSTAAGRPTNAIYGFAVMLGRLLAEERPEYLGVAFDLPGPTFRHERFAAYKIHRPAMPDGLIEQLPTIHTLVAAFRIPIFELAGYEADDVLATLAVQLAARDIDVLLVTGDKDALQLVGPRVKVYNPQRDNLIMDATHVKERFGVEPQRVIDVMALMGDSTDNIPGVPGIGEKTAVALIGRFGSLEGVLEHLDDVPAARRQTLAAHAEQARMARQLAEVDTHVPLAVDLDQLRRSEPDWAALRALYRELEFRTLLKELPAAAPTASTGISVHAASSSADVQQAIDAVRHATRCTLVCVGAAAPVAVAFCTAPDTVHWITPAADPAWRQVRTILEDETIAKVGFDLKAMWRRWQSQGISLRGLRCDVMIAAYLLNPAQGTYGVGELIEAYLGRTLAMPAPVEEGASLVEIPAQSWCVLAAAVHELAGALEARLKEQALERLFHDVELPLCEVLARMEACGIAVDRAALSEMSQRMERRLAQLTDEIFAASGEPFNIHSPKQLAAILFEKLKLPVIKRTKTGPSTDFDVLTRLAAGHPLPKLLVEFRELSKLKSTYVDALPALIDPATGRVHTTFNQTVTATGRLSSSDPNLQNIPIKTELGRQIRRAFVPGRAGWHLLAADYSQIELRVLAHLSEDPVLAEAFRAGRDIHTFTASRIYGVDEREVSPQMRSVAKTTNFGLIYGMGAQSLSRDLAMPLAEAQAFIEAYFKQYPKVRGYLDSQVAFAKEHGFVATLLGRRRYIPELQSPDGGVRAFGERTAINTPVQGSAADLIKVAMLHVDAALRRQRLAARLLVQVHDELVFEAPQEESSALRQLVREQMEGAIALRVPLVITLKMGPNWLDMTEIK